MENKVETELIEISEKMMRNGWSIKEEKPDNMRTKETSESMRQRLRARP